MLFIRWIQRFSQESPKFRLVPAEIEIIESDGGVETFGGEVVAAGGAGEDIAEGVLVVGRTEGSILSH